MRRGAFLLIVLLLGAPAAGQSTDADRGLTGRITFLADDADLDARPDQDLDAPLLVRLRRIGPAGDRFRYEATYIGAVEGTYDLRDWLIRRSGEAPAGLEELPVQIASQLPPDHGTDLFDAPVATSPIRGGYRRWMIAIGALWVAIPLVLLLRRLMAEPGVDVTDAAPAPPTLADQLRPLVEEAIAGRLDVDGRARLELLLFRAWEQRLSLSGTPGAEALATLRRHPESRPLVEALERWLHQPDPDAVTPDELQSLLEPYRAFEPVPDEAMTGDRS